MPTVESWRPNSTPPPPTQLERRPTFEGQAPNVGRLGVFVLLAGALGGGAYLGGVPALGALAFGVVVLVVFWSVDLAFTTGYMHKLAEQRTEKQRIAASLLDIIAVNEAQNDYFDTLERRLDEHDSRLKDLEKISITEQGKTRHINKHDSLDIDIEKWITGEIFASNGVLKGVHPVGYLKGKMPFKEGTDGYERLVRLRLVTKDEGGYKWVGPSTLVDTRERLAIRKGGMVEDD